MSASWPVVHLLQEGPESRRYRDDRLLPPGVLVVAFELLEGLFHGKVTLHAQERLTDGIVDRGGKVRLGHGRTERPLVVDDLSARYPLNTANVELIVEVTVRGVMHALVEPLPELLVEVNDFPEVSGVGVSLFLVELAVLAVVVGPHLDSAETLFPPEILPYPGQRGADVLLHGGLAPDNGFENLARLHVRRLLSGAVDVDAHGVRPFREPGGQEHEIALNPEGLDHFLHEQAGG